MLRAIAAEPWEHLHRLVLADWLEENGETARAQLIRWQVEEQRWPGSNRRAIARLLECHGKAWRGGARNRLFRGGMLEGMQVVLGEHRSRKGLLTMRNEFDLRWVRVQAASPASERHDWRLTDELALQASAGSLVAFTFVTGGLALGTALHSLDQFPDLYDFTIEGPGFSGESVTALAGMPWLPRVGRLELPYLGEADVASLLASGGLDGLTELALTAASSTVTARLGTWPRLRGVSRLGLASCHLVDERIRPLCASDNLGDLCGLDLSNNEVGNAGAAVLAEAGFGPLECLNLKDNRVGEPGLTALTRAAWAESLRRLDLGGNLVLDSGLAALLSSPSLAGLESLDLNVTGIGRDTAFRLAEGPLQRLHSLSLGGNHLGDEPIIALANSPALANLTSLQLYACGMGEAAALALAASPHLTQLSFLEAHWNLIGERGKEAILSRWPFATV
jgi:uncharacterized protein (TIGR02996 family)